MLIFIEEIVFSKIVYRSLFFKVRFGDGMIFFLQRVTVNVV